MEATKIRATDHPPGFTPTPRHPSRAVAGLLLGAHRHEDFEVLEGPRKVLVPSASIPGLKYTVDLAGGLYSSGTCTCPFWRFGDGMWKAVDKHLVAAEFVVLFREAAPGVSFRVERRHDSRLGLTTFDVIERLEDYPAGRCWSTALSFEGALFDVVEAMQDRISEAA